MAWYLETVSNKYISIETQEDWVGILAIAHPSPFCSQPLHFYCFAASLMFVLHGHSSWQYHKAIYCILLADSFWRAAPDDRLAYKVLQSYTQKGCAHIQIPNDMFQDFKFRSHTSCLRKNKLQKLKAIALSVFDRSVSDHNIIIYSPVYLIS